MKIEMLTDRPEHWTNGLLKGKGIIRPSGEVFEVGEDDLGKVQPSSADVMIVRGWAKKFTKGVGPVTAIEGEKDGD